MRKETYSSLLKNAPDVPEWGTYNLNAGEMNPEILLWFITNLITNRLPLVIWEPFAGTSFVGSSPRSNLQNIAEADKVSLISYGLEPADKRIKRADSTVVGPNTKIGGILFHPPYFGTAPMSNNEQDISLIHDKGSYKMTLGKALDNAMPFMVPNGLACVIGRSYRTCGEAYRLDIVLLQLFESRGFTLKNVWKSSPDIVMIMSSGI